MSGVGGHGGIRGPLTPRERRALLLWIALLVLLSAGMGWLVTHGVQRGEAPFPSPRATLQRSVSREVEPTMFWVTIGLYGSIGAGALVLAAWTIRVTVRAR